MKKEKGIVIRRAKKSDSEAIWEILKSVISAGDTYAFAPDSPKKELLEYWFAKDNHVYVATQDKRVIGTFYIRDNQPGLASHVANAAYAVSPAERGKGIGKMMGEYSLVEAKRLGYQAMQFNLVVKTNTAAVELWKSLGFRIVGEIAKAFKHKELGEVSAYIMHRFL
ncbi:MAG: GNAT family N-acetyltransferase [Bacteroidia bacterium]